MGKHNGQRDGLEAAEPGLDFMNSNADFEAGESSRGRGRKSKSRRKQPRGRPRKANTLDEQNGDPELAAPGSLTRTKALLLAALRVWELKHRIGD